jgi:hypothetical protein
MNIASLFTHFDSLAHRYSESIFNILAPQTRLIFNAGFGVWILYMLIYKGCVKSNLRKDDFLIPLFYCIGVSLFLSGYEYYREWIYTPIYEGTTATAQAIIGAGSSQTHTHTITGMLETMNTKLGKVFLLSDAICTDAGWTHPILSFGGVFIVLPFIFVKLIFLAYVVEMVFKLLLMTTLSPLLIMCMAFPSLRGFPIAGLRVIANGCFTLIFAAVAMGFTLSALDGVISSLPMGADGFTINASTFVFSDDYWTLFILGFISILFHLKASTVASNISGSQDGPGATAAVTGAGMAAFAFAKGQAQKLTQKAGGTLGQRMDDHLKKTNFRKD